MIILRSAVNNINLPVGYQKYKRQHHTTHVLPGTCPEQGVTTKLCTTIEVTENTNHTIKNRCMYRQIISPGTIFDLHSENHSQVTLSQAIVFSDSV